MAVTADESGMLSEESAGTRNSSHEFNAYIDRQLQNNLLQAADDLDAEEYEQKLSNAKSGGNLKSSAKSSKLNSAAENVSGWIPDTSFVARRTDVVKPETRPPPKDTFIHPWRDYRSKKEENFVFKHYTERKKYIEQYRTDHGCHNSRNTSGAQTEYSRRVAFQTTPAQPSAPQVPVQVSMQQIQQVWSPQSTNQTPPAQYSNRREQLGTLIAQGPNASSTCTCNKPNHTLVDQSHKYKLAQNTGPFARVNTETRSPAESDNSSETGDSRCRTPIRRINSAASSRGRTSIKQPTKISVPANQPRTYPIQALTIAWRLHQRQQNGAKPETKPLDNLACVAPDKQSLSVERKPVEPLGLALKVQSLNDLLTTNEAPLRGYALPKSTPHPNTSSSSGEGSEASDADSDLFVLDADNNNDAVSIDQISTCPLSADMPVKPRPEKSNAQLLQMFLKDPVLSRLNQRPPVKQQAPEVEPSSFDKERMVLSTPKLLGSESFLIPQNDVDTMLRVNMWNPIVSTPPHVRKDPPGQNFRTLMTQVPFKKQGQEQPKRPTTMPATGNGHRVTENSSGKQDFFNPVKKIKLSITRLNNGVSFCRTQVQSESKNTRRSSSLSRGTHSTSKDSKGKDDKYGNVVNKHSLSNRSENQHSQNSQNVNQKAPYDPYVDKLKQQVKFDQKMTFPLPQVKIFESVPIITTPVHSCHSRNGSELPNLESKLICDSQRQSRQSSARPKSSVNGMINSNDNREADQVRQRSATSVKSNLTSTLSVENHNVYVSMDTFKEDRGTDTAGWEMEPEKVETKVETKVDIEQKTKAAELALSLLQMNVENDKNGQTMVAKGTKAMKEMNSKNIANGYKTHPKVVKKPAVASGVVTFSSSPKATKQKQLRQEQALDGLTWAEKLELLRSVNKPRNKPKARRQKIKYIKADSDPNKVFDSPEHEELYEQRRIKHLVEQARLKGGKQFDWVYEAQVKSRGIDWNSGTIKADNSTNKIDSSTEKVNNCITSSGDSSSQSDEEAGVGDDGKFGKYGIYVPPRDVRQKLLKALSVQRSRTFVAP